jgi:6-phosphogluconolactonase
VAERGAFMLALAGGSTPSLLYRLLADPAAPYRVQIAWASVHAFFGDERAVPPDHPESNYRMARQALLAQVPIGSVHRIPGELGAGEAAVRCEADLRNHFGAVAFPAFDLVLLGLGTDGHTASLFPGSPALRERVRWAVAGPGPPPATERITLTVPVLEEARAVVFLVTGAGKAPALRRLLLPRAGEEPVPAALLRPRGTALVIADAAAAAGLDGGNAP